MIETVIVWLIIAACCYFVGRKFFRQFKSLAAKDTPGCNGDCGCCSSGKGLHSHK